MKRIIAVLLITISVFLYAQNDIVNARIEFPVKEMEVGSEIEVILVLDIKEGWHINSAEVLDKYSIPTKVSLKNSDEFNLKNIQYPEGKLTPISWGGNMSLYEAEVRIPAVLQNFQNIEAGLKDIEIEISYQACNDVTCMSPESILLLTHVNIISANIPIQNKTEHSEVETEIHENYIEKEENTDEISFNQVNLNKIQSVQSDEAVGSTEDDNPFQNKSMLLILLIVFVMGLALNLTPCVYPLIPITMGYFLAQKDSRSPVLLAVMYVLGLAITYSIIGTLAAFGGSMMGALLAHPATLIFFSVLMLALSLSMFGLYEFKLPNALTQTSGGSRSGAIGALIMGLTMGIVAAPCVGPFVVSLLGFVAQKGSIFIGFITFFVLALGLGVPYLFLGIFSTRIKSLPQSGEWLNGVRIFFGLALIGMAIYFVLPLIPGTFSKMILPVYMIIAAVYYAVIDKSGISILRFARLKVILAMIVLALGIFMIKPVTEGSSDISWDVYSETILENAIEDRTPVIIDFYADWCNPCKELEHITFTDPEVQEILKDFIRLKVDLTVVNDSTNAIKRKFEIPGVPTIIFYDRTGNERKKLRLNGFERPKDFINRLEALLSE
ncbi:MAG: cytochrome c biogenesis protein CcdA [Candidatus Marinimicrobia bacterium]|nr:cytochrome c biogenesis protein CcdA [Candidatus Neomarinimicrobiota bacterium]